MDIIRQCLQIASTSENASWICPLLFIGDAALSLLVVLKIPYTEIDWIAYMQQVRQYIDGERDYVKLYGDTGPLVYPAAHVYIYRFLHYLTDNGNDIRTGQYIFIGVYLATLAVAMQCYRQAKTPPYVFPLLVMSKRMHSIFLLRMFNDGLAVLFLFVAILCFQRRLWTAGSLAYSVGLGVKMSLLLALPAIGVVLWLGMGRNRAIQQAMIMGQVQLLLGYTFLASNPGSYVFRAFELSRQFLFKWTVNWRFVGEDAFLSREFSISLLIAHATLLATFFATRWLSITGWSVADTVRRLLDPPHEAERAKISRNVSPQFVLTTTLTAMIVGCLCARSLHYQFYTYIAWSTPFLLWRGGLHPVLTYAIWAAQEWAWNVFPSTNTSSMMVVGCLTLAVASVWLGTSENVDRDCKYVDQQRAG